jgi:hypothetical protein
MKKFSHQGFKEKALRVPQVFVNGGSGATRPILSHIMVSSYSNSNMEALWRCQFDKQKNQSDFEYFDGTFLKSKYD